MLYHLTKKCNSFLNYLTSVHVFAVNWKLAIKWFLCQSWCDCVLESRSLPLGKPRQEGDPVRAANQREILQNYWKREEKVPKIYIQHLNKTAITTYTLYLTHGWHTWHTLPAQKIGHTYSFLIATVFPHFIIMENSSKLWDNTKWVM